MNNKNIQEKHFYIAQINGVYYKDKTIKTVVQCTKIQKFYYPKNIIDIVYHFKNREIGECVITISGMDGSISKKSRNIENLTIIEEIFDDKLKDTSIIFIDETHYKKLVNKGKYKQYELKDRKFMDKKELLEKIYDNYKKIGYTLDETVYIAIKELVDKLDEENYRIEYTPTLTGYYQYLDKNKELKILPVICQILRYPLLEEKGYITKDELVEVMYKKISSKVTNKDNEIIFINTPYLLVTYNVDIFKSPEIDSLAIIGYVKCE